MFPPVRPHLGELLSPPSGLGGMGADSLGLAPVNHTMAAGHLPLAETAEELVDVVAGLSEKGFSDPPHFSHGRVLPWLLVGTILFYFQGLSHPPALTRLIRLSASASVMPA